MVDNERFEDMDFDFEETRLISLASSSGFDDSVAVKCLQEIIDLYGEDGRDFVTVEHCGEDYLARLADCIQGDEVWDTGAFDPECPDDEYGLDTGKELEPDPDYMEDSESEDDYAPDSEDGTDDEVEPQPKRPAAAMSKDSSKKLKDDNLGSQKRPETFASQG